MKNLKYVLLSGICASIGLANPAFSASTVDVANPNAPQEEKRDIRSNEKTGGVKALEVTTIREMEKESGIEGKSQEAYEREVHDKKTKAGNSAKAAGGAQQALGILQIAMGTALLPPPTTPAGVALIASGIMNLMQGKKGEKGGNELLNDAWKADGYAADMSNINDKPTDEADLNSGRSVSPDKLKIDSSLYGEEANKLFDKLESTTGLSKDEFLNALNNGEDIFEVASRAKGINMSADELRDYASGMSAGDAPENKSELDENLSAVVDEINKNADLKYSGGGTGNLANAAGDDSGASSTPDFASLFKKGGKDGAGEGTNLDKLNRDLASRISDYDGFSDGLKDKLAQEGFNNKSIFQMVRDQYQQETPTMLGLDKPSVIDKTLSKALEI